MSKAKDFGLLKKLDYPPYQIICNSLTSFIVCGGGGGSYKSGIPNKIEIYDLKKINSSTITEIPILKELASFDTDKRLVTSISRHFNYLLTAEKNNLYEYIVLKRQQPDGNMANDDTKDEAKNEDLQLKLHRRIENCFESQDKAAEINIVKYCGHVGSTVIVCGSKGAIKVFQRYNREKPMELVLLKEFIDVSDGKNLGVIALDVSPNGEEFVTICDNPDGKYARVWSITRGVKITELALMSPGKKKIPIKCSYKFKHCCYRSSYFKLDRRPSFLLYTTHQPMKMNPNALSFMSVWGPTDPLNGNDYQLIDVISLGNNKTPFFSPTTKLIPTALAVSGNGLLSSIGSGEGQVNVYRLNTDKSCLELIYHLAGAHSFIVTAMTFMPSSRVVATGHEFELVSVGIDTMLRYHRQPAAVTYLRLERLYSLLCLFVVAFLCDRLLILLNLF